MSNCLVDFAHDCIHGSGGLHDFEDREMATPNIDRDEAVARWVLRCLGNIDYELSSRALEAILEHREGVAFERLAEGA
jgi:hypothetical protein